MRDDRNRAASIDGFARIGPLPGPPEFAPGEVGISDGPVGRLALRTATAVAVLPGLRSAEAIRRGLAVHPTNTQTDRHPATRPS
jgi:hypothetical protein